MLLFGHVGITLGAGALAARAVSYKRENKVPKTSWFAALSRYADIRLLIIGSMLPDIIDKPIGQYFFRETFNNGRIFAHTLLFLVVITVAGYILYRRFKQVWMLTLAAGVFMHIGMDEMWQFPETFLWPALGFHFPEYELADWATNIFQALLSNPYIYVSEAIGLAILIWFGLSLRRRKQFQSFLRQGKIY